MNKKTVSDKVVSRLPQYLQVLEEFAEQGITIVSSKSIACKLHATGSQVRQDLCCFGDFGNQGLGYSVQTLIGAIRKIIGLTKEYEMIIVGAGNIGNALANYGGFTKEGYVLTAMFDKNEEKVDLNSNPPVYHISFLEEYLRENPNIAIAVICTGKSSAQAVADRLVKANVVNIWNFAPVNLVVPKNVLVEDVRLSASLYVLTYNMNNKK